VRFGCWNNTGCWSVGVARSPAEEDGTCSPSRLYGFAIGYMIPAYQPENHLRSCILKSPSEKRFLALCKTSICRHWDGKGRRIWAKQQVETSLEAPSLGFQARQSGSSLSAHELGSPCVPDGVRACGVPGTRYAGFRAGKRPTRMSTCHVTALHRPMPLTDSRDSIRGDNVAFVHHPSRQDRAAK
jgi:hypothetical protein